MSNEFTPSTEQVRGAYVRAIRNAFVGATSEHEAEFDRWLERVKAEAQVEAMREQADAFKLAAVMGIESSANRASAEVLYSRAYEIAREAGIETGESK